VSERAPIEWAISAGLVGYDDAVAAMQARAAAIADGHAAELVWLLEHSALYTAGTSARPADLLEPERFPVHASGRGGQYTYHGPGQRIAYVMLRLERTDRDVRRFVTALEAWIIATLSRFNVRGEVRDGRVGVWVARPDRGAGSEDKIAALGLRVSRGVSLHGISLNVDPDLAHFAGIVPCGIAVGTSGHGVTSLVDLGHIVSVPEVDMALRSAFEATFGQTVDAEPPVMVDAGTR
jgi:lipoyl(octanoyl) transferase